MKSNLQKRINQAERLLILGPQPFSTKSLRKSLLIDIQLGGDREKVLIIFVDGGTRHKKKIELLAPHLTRGSFSIGDNDSSSVKLDQIKTTQQYSDLRYLLDSVVKLQPKLLSVCFLGFLNSAERSQRYDHLLVNIGEISHFQQGLTATPQIILDAQLFFLKRGTWIFDIHTTFSLLSLKPIHATISGQCTYAYTGKIDCLSSQGLSNEGSGVVKIKTNGQCILILNKK